jgi:tubulin--tyrosine ligase
METPRGRAASALKSKMKAMDPNEFSIHDFLGECKQSDAAASRFDARQGVAEQASFVLGAPALKLGNLAREVGELLAREGLQRKKDDSGRFHVILGGRGGAGIPFKRFAQLFKWDYGIVPHCNCFRGHVFLTHKVKLAQMLRQAGLEALQPETFLFFPSSAEDNETDELRAACESGAKRSGAAKAWIVKASDATRGERTMLSEDFGAILAHLEAQDKTSAAWAIQRYIDRPLLLPGGRKFDLRFFVLVDAQLQAHFCAEPLVKLCGAAFAMDDLLDRLAHLSCDAVQQDAAPGRAAATMPAEQLQKWLAAEHGAAWNATVLQPARRAVLDVVEAARDKLENAEHADFTSFQVFCFDFLLDQDLKLWFLECGAPIDVPDELVNDMARDVVDIAIKPVLAPKDERGSAAQGAPPGRVFVKLGKEVALARPTGKSSNQSSKK